MQSTPSAYVLMPQQDSARHDSGIIQVVSDPIGFATTRTRAARAGTMNAKRAGYAAARIMGLTSVVAASGWRKRRLLILCYHGVSSADEHEWDPTLYVPAGHLRDRLAWLRSHRYTLLPLRDAVGLLVDDALPARSVAITFDDGLRDFYTVALPLLREFDAPATVYLATYYSENDYPVFDPTLAYLLWKGRHSGADLGPAIGLPNQLRVASPAERSYSYIEIYDFARQRSLNAGQKNDLLAEIAAAMAIDFSAFSASGLLHNMTPGQVKSLPRDLIDIALHTHRHRTPRTEPAFDREIADNQAAIERLTGDTEVREHFCYPSGDYDARFLPWLRHRGVRWATTCVPGLASADCDPLLLPRFLDNALVPLDSFAAWSSGLAELLPRRAEYRIDHDRRVDDDPWADSGGNSASNVEDPNGKHDESQK